MEATRVDRWLWAVRLYKTRSIATDACRAGHVRLRGTAVKPAHLLKVGDVVEVRIDAWERRVEVTRAIDKRVGPGVAAECFIDHSPPRPPRELVPAPLFARLPASGRPTKRERRDLDRFRGR